MAKSVVGIGMVTLDFISRVSRFPREDSVNLVNEECLAVGGPIGRAVLVVSRLGHPSCVVGMIGSGVFAQMLRMTIAEESLATTMVTRPGLSQHSIVIVADEAQSRTTLWHPQPRASEELLDKVDDLVREAAVIVADCTDLVLAERVMGAATRYGTPVVVDTGSYKPGSERIWTGADIVAVPEKFLAAKYGNHQNAFNLKALAHEMNTSVTIVTRGAEGGIAYERVRDHMWSYEAMSVAVVDSCGAGDAFHGALAYGIAQGWDMDRVVSTAAWVAGRKCAGLGNATLPHREELAAWLQTKGLDELP